MANILDRYGIKEVADVTFYDLDNAGLPTHPVLYLDTLKVSTIEQTAEEAEARGGKGNAALIAWDYGKEINVTLEDALFSAKSMAIMFGNGTVKDFDSSDSSTNPETSTTADFIMKTVQLLYNKTQPTTWTGPDGKEYTMLNAKYYDAKSNPLAVRSAVETDEGTPAVTWALGRNVEETKAGENGGAATTTTVFKELETNERYFCTFDLRAKGAVIEVSGNSFPGTYYVVGDTFARSEASGNDEMFQFVIPKAKVTSENTITLEAEGDPSVFNMSLKVLRPADGIMMKLIKYELIDGNETAADSTAKLVHNHELDANPTAVVADNEDE